MACLRQLVANKPATLRGRPGGGGAPRGGVRDRRLRAASRCLQTCFLIRRSRSEEQSSWIIRSWASARTSCVSLVGFVRTIATRQQTNGPGRGAVLAGTPAKTRGGRSVCERARAANPHAFVACFDTAAGSKWRWTRQPDDLTRLVARTADGRGCRRRACGDAGRALKAGAQLRELDPSGGASERIQAKKLRYALGVLWPALPRQEGLGGGRTASGRTGETQGASGMLNDIAVHAGDDRTARRWAGTLTKALAKGMPRKGCRGVAFLVMRKRRIASVLKMGAAYAASLRKAKPFGHDFAPRAVTSRAAIKKPSFMRVQSGRSTATTDDDLRCNS